MAQLYHRKLTILYDDLTVSEQKIAQYIENHGDELRDMSSNALAAASGVSQPTVIRFSKKLGYSSFKHLIKDLCVEAPDAYINMDISVDDDTRSTNAQLAEQYSTIIKMTLSLNTPEAVDQAVADIYRAKQIVIAGFSERNYMFADYLAYRFENIGLNAYTHSHSSMIYAKLSNCEPGDVVILLSESGETRDILNFAKLAKTNGMHVISVTRAGSNTLQTLSDVNFRLVEYGIRTFMRTCMVRLSMLCVIDMIFLNLTKLDYDKFWMQSKRLNRMTKLAFEVPNEPERKKE